MNWVILLIIGLASLALIVGGFAYVGLKAWRLAKHGLRVSKDVMPLTDHLSRQAQALSASADRLASNGEQLSANVARLQVTITRLQVVGEALADATAPFRRIKDYLGR